MKRVGQLISGLSFLTQKKLIYRILNNSIMRDKAVPMAQVALGDCRIVSGQTKRVIARSNNISQSLRTVRQWYRILLQHGR